MSDTNTLVKQNNSPATTEDLANKTVEAGRSIIKNKKLSNQDKKELLEKELKKLESTLKQDLKKLKKRSKTGLLIAGIGVLSFVLIKKVFFQPKKTCSEENSEQTPEKKPNNTSQKPFIIEAIQKKAIRMLVDYVSESIQNSLKNRIKKDESSKEA